MCNLKEIKYPITAEYRSGDDYDPLLFFMDAFSNSRSFDLLLGYFSSTAFNVLSLGFSKFLINGGKMRMVINNVLSKEDKMILVESSGSEPESEVVQAYQFNSIISKLNSHGKHTLECLAWLLKNERLEIVAIKPKKGNGIAHFKSGIFSDDKQSISFSGSCNFTANALVNNLEQVSIKRDWISEHERLSIEDGKRYFDEIYSGSSNKVEIIPFSDIEARIISEYGEKKIEEIVRDEQELLEKLSLLYTKNTKLKFTSKKLIDDILFFNTSPKFPYPSGARDYQKEAHINWIAKGKKGIFAMATGTGKTITSLNCLLEEFKSNKLYQSIILVPTNDLQKQWVSEVSIFNFRNVITVGIDKDWKHKLSKLTTLMQYNQKQSFIIIATYSSFGRDTLKKFIKYLPDDTLFIADEAHNIASPKMKVLLPQLTFKKRIGLSATPKRIYDPEGTDEMNLFFEDKPPYVYEYSMEQAIINGVLCKYDYYPHIVPLTDGEFTQYKKITLQLMSFFDPVTKKFDMQKASALLLKRKRIIHKAENKLAVFKTIISKEINNRGSLKYTFVYVPEGVDQNNEEEENIIYQYNKVIMDVSSNIRVAGFTGQIKDRELILNHFENGNIDVLTAMKCLDEGVDIPRAELAIFCSSTANPRQFIQRRGRILRQHKDKKYAVIHDLIVVPRDLNKIEKESITSMERSLITNELKRVADFAFMARNQFDALDNINEICSLYDLNLYEIKKTIE